MMVGKFRIKVGNIINGNRTKSSDALVKLSIEEEADSQYEDDIHEFPLILKQNHKNI
jgi:hypothetical protein